MNNTPIKATYATDATVNRPIGCEASHTPLSDIPAGEKYLYIITPTPETGMLKGMVNSVHPLNPRIQQDVCNHLCKIIFIQHHEAQSGSTIPDALLLHLNLYIANNNIPPAEVYYIHGNLRGQETMDIYGFQFNYLGVNPCEHWNAPIGTTPVKYTGDKLLLNYNRQPRNHRIIIIAELLRHQLLDRCLVSFNTVEGNLHWADGALIFNVGNNRHIRYADETIMPYAKQLGDIQPLRLETQTTDNLAITLYKPHYEESFISLVTETFAFETDILLISEKSWKPILFGHPFMIFGNYGTLAQLKQWGYRTFDKWIDESYDLNLPFEDRVQVIIKEILRFSKMSLLELQTLRVEMFPVCLHNQQLHRTRAGSARTGAIYLRENIQNIWSDLNR